MAAGIKTGAPIFEANSYPGGICRSYTKNGYRFEAGGGHWIFGNDKSTLNFINSLSPLKIYQRNPAVYFPDKGLYIPYPLQNHLSYLPKEITKKALSEIRNNANKTLPAKATFADWLLANFGKTLCDLFLFPFHQLYTAGLYTKIAPQDKFKTPTNKKNSGYNKIFTYPKRGLANLIEKMAKKCQINYNKRAVEINIKRKEVSFEDGTKLRYKKIISTLPLNKMVRLTGIHLDEPSAPYTSMIVINIGARRERKCPHYHWLYIPESKSGFYRVGFYSNVNNSFLLSTRKNKVSLYVDKAYLGGKKPSDKEIKRLAQNVIKEGLTFSFSP